MSELEGKAAPEIKITTGDRVTGEGAGIKKQAGEGENFNDVEVLAMRMGWNPEHDEKSGRAFKTAEQYIVDSKQIQDTTVKTLNTLKETNKELVGGMQNLKTHYNKMAEVEKTRIDTEIADLKGKRNKAIEDSDKEIVKTVDGQIENLQNSKKDMDDSIQQQQVGANAFETLSKEWRVENTWYGKNQEMTNYVDAQSERFRGLDPPVYFERLTEVAMTMFPDQFKGQQKVVPGTAQQQTQNQQQVVGGQTRQTGAGAKIKATFNDLSPDQQKWASFYEKNKVMSKQEYVDEQVKIGNIQTG